MNTNKTIVITLVSCILFLNSCHVNSLSADNRHDSFLYKPLDNAPAYMVKLPIGSKIEYYLIGNSTGYCFSYHNSYFYISNESPLYDSLSSDIFIAIHNNLVEVQDSLKNGSDITCPKQGGIYVGGGDSLLWKYYMLYDLERANPVLGVCGSGFEYLVVGYTHATPADTAVLNSYISTAIKVETSVKKNKMNRMVRYADYIR